MELTINQLAKEFEIMAQEHKQINSFFFGEFFQAFAQADAVVYPLMVVSLLPGGMSEKTVNVNCVITICDKYITDDMRSVQEVHSDCLQILRDIDITLRQERFEDLTLNTQATTEPFVERQADIIAGWSMTTALNVFDLQDWCAIPYYNYDFENGSGFSPACDPVTITNSNGSYTATAYSGETFELPNTILSISVAGQAPVTQQIPTLKDEVINIVWQ